MAEREIGTTADNTTSPSQHLNSLEGQESAHTISPNILPPANTLLQLQQIITRLSAPQTPSLDIQPLVHHRQKYISILKKVSQVDQVLSHINQINSIRNSRNTGVQEMAEASVMASQLRGYNQTMEMRLSILMENQHQLEERNKVLKTKLLGLKSQADELSCSLRNLNQRLEEKISEVEQQEIEMEKLVHDWVQQMGDLLIAREQYLTVKNITNRCYNYYLNPENVPSVSKDHRLLPPDSYLEVDLRCQIIADIVYYLITQTNLKSERLLRSSNLQAPHLQKMYPKSILLQSNGFQIITQYLSSARIQKGKYELRRNISILIREDMLGLVYDCWQILLKCCEGQLRCKEINSSQLLLQNSSKELIMIRINPQKAPKRSLTINLN